MNEPKLNVDYGKTAYVSPCGARMLDAIEQSGLRIIGTGDGLVFTDYEDLEEFLDDLTVSAMEGSKTFKFLRKAYLEINNTKAPEDNIGDVVFAI